MSLLIGIFTFALILVSLFLILVVLMQKAKSDGGVAAMGGGMAESAFGADTSNVLVGATRTAAIIFFVLSFLLYLAHIYQAKHHVAGDSKLPVVSAPAALPSTPAPITAPASTGPEAVKPATPPASEPKKP
jgi:preprotein translocase subunit SecG